MKKKYFCLLLSFAWVLTLLSTGQLAAQSLPGPGQALTFNGFSTYVQCGTSNRGITQSVTAEAWIKTTNSGYQWIVSKYINSGSDEHGFHLITFNGTAGFYGRAGVGFYLISGLSSTRVDDGQWHHLAGVSTYGSGIATWQIYVDGVLENSSTFNVSQHDLTSSVPLTIGNYFIQSGQYFDGQIDEVRLWRTARTQTEVRDNMCRKFVTAPADLVAYYRLDQSNGPLASDAGSQPVNGLLQNFSNNAWQLSGAPLGDVSAHTYTTNWSAARPLGLATTPGDSAVVSAVSAQTRGVQLYVINTSPSIAPPVATATSYFGVFTAGSASATNRYNVRLRQAGAVDCANTYARPGNDLAWTAVANLNHTPTGTVVPAATYRGEYITTAYAAAITGDSLLCAGTTTTLTVTAPSNLGYTWSTGATTAQLANIGVGTYTVQVRFPGGCVRTLRRTVRTGPKLAVSITGDSSICASGSTVLLAAVAGATAYHWSTGATTASLTITQPGTYTVTVSYGSGCTAVARRQVRLATLPPLSLGADTTLCEGDRLTLKGPAGAGFSYEWSDGSTAPTLAASTTGTYTLRLRSSCGTQSASRQLVFRPCVTVPNIITPNGDQANEQLAIEGLVGEGWSLEVYNRWGRSVFATANYHNDWGHDASPGVYYIYLRRPATGSLYKGWLEVVR